MSKKCEISGTGVMSGNNVSHANNKTRRRFLPNLKVVSLLSEKLNRIFKLKVCSKTLRSIEHNGGLDSYLESTSNTKLTDEAKNSLAYSSRSTLAILLKALAVLMSFGVVVSEWKYKVSDMIALNIIPATFLSGTRPFSKYKL